MIVPVAIKLEYTRAGSKIIKSLVALGILSGILASTPAYATGPGSGSDTKYNLDIGGCSIDSITVRWKLDSLMGEPTVNGSYKWSGDEDCSLPSNTKILLKLEHGYNSGYLAIAPAVPKANSGFGYNVSGSPSWSSAVCDYINGQKSDCLDRDDAIDVWKNGSVVDFEVYASGGDQGRSRSRSCEQKRLTRNEYGYERYQCTDCSTVKISTGKNRYQQQTYNGYTSLSQAVREACE